MNLNFEGMPSLTFAVLTEKGVLDVGLPDPEGIQESVDLLERDLTETPDLSEEGLVSNFAHYLSWDLVPDDMSEETSEEDVPEGTRSFARSVAEKVISASIIRE